MIETLRDSDRSVLRVEDINDNAYKVRGIIIDRVAGSLFFGGNPQLMATYSAWQMTSDAGVLTMKKHPTRRWINEVEHHYYALAGDVGNDAIQWLRGKLLAYGFQPELSDDCQSSEIFDYNEEWRERQVLLAEEAANEAAIAWVETRESEESGFNLTYDESEEFGWNNCKEDDNDNFWNAEGRFEEAVNEITDYVSSKD